MSKPERPPPSDDDLRRQAEQRLRERRPDDVRRSARDLDRLVHELEVHQVELELQNEELLRSREEIEGAAREYAELYDFAPVGFFTLDDEGTIQRTNITGATLLGVERSQLVGGRFERFVAAGFGPAFKVFLGQVFASEATEPCELGLRTVANPELFVRLEALLAEDGQECRLAVMDISSRRGAEEAREALVRDLQAALEQVTQLSGILPICASCKKIRDDQGYWSQVESYVEQHSEAVFSHALCPGCLETLYPDHVDENE
jgi:hypothetical protein